MRTNRSMRSRTWALQVRMYWSPPHPRTLSPKCAPALALDPSGGQADEGCALAVVRPHHAHLLGQERTRPPSRSGAHVGTKRRATTWELSNAASAVEAAFREKPLRPVRGRDRTKLRS